MRILNGDVRTILPTLELESIHCCVTSPPYFGLRDYGCDGQIGLEKTPDEYVAEMVNVFREVRRVLRSDGTLWLNLGDSYAAHPGQRKASDIDNSPKQQSNLGSVRIGSRAPMGLKPKDMIGIPWRVAFALQDDGWYLRQDIIWHKPNPMPESVTDRCTKAHEYIFLFSKSERYHFDSSAIAEPSIYGDIRRPYGSRGAWEMDGRPQEQQHGGENRASAKRGDFGGKNTDIPGKEALRAITDFRNKRDVWTVPTAPYAAAHFATFPPELIKPCILAGCPKGGVVLDPFGGSGTTAMVARDAGCDAVLIELNPAYISLIHDRLAQNVFTFQESECLI